MFMTFPFPKAAGSKCGTGHKNKLYKPEHLPKYWLCKRLDFGLFILFTDNYQDI